MYMFAFDGIFTQRYLISTVKPSLSKSTCLGASHFLTPPYFTKIWSMLKAPAYLTKNITYLVIS